MVTGAPHVAEARLRRPRGLTRGFPRNKQGKATIHFARPIPEDLPDDAYIKVVVRSIPDTLVYVTDRHQLDWYKK